MGRKVFLDDDRAGLELVRRSYHQPAVRLDPDAARCLNPLNAVPDRAGPLIPAVGAEESDAFQRQQQAYGAAWRAAGLPLQVADLPERPHFTTVDALGQADHPLFQVVARLALNRGGGGAI